MTEDVPLALITQDFPRVWGALCKKGMKTKYTLPVTDHSPTGGYTENRKQMATSQQTTF